MSLRGICQRLRPQFSGVRQLSQVAGSSQQPRGLLQVPPLRDEEILQRYGIPGLYGKETFKIAWYDWQGQMVRRINDLTAEGTLAHKDPKTILLQTARDPQQAALFNYASMAWNNHFYFDKINIRAEEGDHNQPIPIPIELERELVRDFSSIESLRTELLATAYSMFGPGFVWLVRSALAHKNSTHRWFILTTYLAGSPLAGAHNRLQPVDMNTQNPASGLTREDVLRQSTPQNYVGSFGGYGPKPRVSYGGIEVVPCLCVNTWQHAWMFDWTLAGKMEFLEAWWERVEWNRVAQAVNLRTETRSGDLAYMGTNGST
ncbi:Fe superoxide dismutase-like protein [Trichodelitschia bisporula]|uniref:Fe superoxide dismutase-like protein n=1 Tax=Trichodelitschia bisporula TaxID=703511 RepID=A0A6G1IBB8_9PEZI|nr:Fe superoxide dismutase-like protein [Trichodelitschia bisporula]